MKKFVRSMLFGLVTINTMMAAGTTRPRLIVGIVVDQLRTDYLEFLKTTFGREGFNKLRKEGLYLQDIDFHQSVKDAPAATAVIFTGAWPRQTGVPSATVFDATTKRDVPVLADKQYRGVNSQAGYSAEALRLSTISDEIAIDGLGSGMIYSLSADPQQAVIMSGHAGKGAFWIDDNSGKWASTTYYQEMPASLAQYNRISPLSSRIDTIVWKPMMRPEAYPDLPGVRKQSAFRYTFPKSDRNSYIKFKQTPRGNDELTDAAITLLKNIPFGKSDAVDMLNVAYTLAPYGYDDDGDNRMELEDAYIRLDSQLARLFAEIDRTVGLDNTLIFLSSTGYYEDNKREDEKYRIPTGEFSLKRAESLLNSYLSATYGNGGYVLSMKDGKVTLNAKLIDEKRMPISTIREEARNFLVKMSGVYDGFTVDEILNSGQGGRMDLRLTTDPKYAADIYLEFTPGWILTDDSVVPAKQTTVHHGQVRTPAFLLAPNLQAETITEGIDATILAPTITSNLHIRAPNGAREKPMR